MSVQNIHDKLMVGICNEIGVCALMGNMQAESALKSTNVQNSYESKLGMDDATYTAAVDSGAYGKFASDSAGYGLCQWTSAGRKQGLLDYAKSIGVSIGDESMQCDYALYELATSYKSVLEALRYATSIREASDIVLKKFERPKDQSEAVCVARAKLGQQLYDQLVGSPQAPKKTRAAMVDLALSMVGLNEADGSYKKVIDLYNSYAGPFPRGTKMQYGWAWCACFWSALAIKLGYTDIVPIEISCFYLIEAAKKMGVWIEQDNRVPKLGEAVLYDWDDGTNFATTDNTGNPEHVGIVVEVNEAAGYFVVVEGNYSNAVKKRTVAINGRYIRGFISPKYDEDGVVQTPAQTSGKSVDTVAHEVIAGTWGNNPGRKQALEAAGYDYAAVQARVNEILNGSAAKPAAPTQTATKEVKATEYAQYGPDASLAGTYKTTANLYMRNGAGTNKKALVLIPKGTAVRCYGYYNKSGSVKWLYIEVTLDGVKYTGFSSSEYLKK